MRLRLAILPFVLMASLPLGAQSAMVFKLGTVAPRDSSFHQILEDMGKEWRAQNVVLKVYPGGVRGGEAEMVQYMRSGALDAALITGVGLGTIDPSAEAIQSFPMLFRSLDEVDFAVGKLRPRIEHSLRDKGFVVLFWCDAGWVRIFSSKPVTHPDDLRKLKIFTWAGDVLAVDLYKANGFRPVPLETNDILPALQTGMIEAIPMPPYMALMTQVSTHAPHMLAIDWAPLIGALVISERSWNRLTPDAQRELARAAARAGQRMKARNRLENERSVEAMKKRNLQVTAMSAQVDAEWRSVAERTYPRLRGGKIPADLYDEMSRLLAEYRREKGSQQ